MIDASISAGIGLIADPSITGLVLGATSPREKHPSAEDRKVQAAVLIGFASFKYFFSKTPLRDYSSLATLFTYCMYTSQVQRTDSWIIVPFVRVLLEKDAIVEQLCMIVFLRALFHGSRFFSEKRNSAYQILCKRVLPISIVPLLYYSTLQGPYLPLIGALSEINSLDSKNTHPAFATYFLCSALDLCFNSSKSTALRSYAPYLSMAYTSMFLIPLLWKQTPTRPNQNDKARKNSGVPVRAG